MTMSDLDHRELAQEGLKLIEDAIVGLLTRHSDGMPPDQIAGILGLRAGGDPAEQDRLVDSILAFLVKSGRILWDADARRYKDNPDYS
jgi:hypothetical protein